jgi:hypothetical protein
MATMALGDFLYRGGKQVERDPYMRVVAAVYVWWAVGYTKRRASAWLPGTAFVGLTSARACAYVDAFCTIMVCTSRKMLGH